MSTPPVVTLEQEGVLYQPGAPQSSILVDDLRNHGIRYVRVQWIGLTNDVRCRVLALPYFEKLVKVARPGFTVPKAALGIVIIDLAEGFSVLGEWLYAIDLSSIKICPYAPGHATVVGWFEEKVPIPGLQGHRSLEVDLCPRTILRRVVEKAKQISGVEFLVGFETEFILIKNTDSIQLVNPHGWSHTRGLVAGTTEAQVLEEIADALTLSGIEVQAYHSEAAPSQYEIVTGPLPPLQAADSLVHTRETIHAVASKHGLKATLAPNVIADSCGSGAHAHISVHGPNKTPSAHEYLSKVEASFLAGVLEHLPALSLLLLPTFASYGRVVDGIWSGGTYVSWGKDHKEVPLRLCNAHSPSSRNFEVKTLDATANPYVALAGILGAGLEGITQSKELTIQNHSSQGYPASLTKEEREKLGIKEQLPLSWEDAKVKFEQGEIINHLFGDDFKTKYLAIQQMWKDKMTLGLTEEEALKFLVENY